MTSSANGWGARGELRQAKDAQVARYREASKAADTSVAATIVGEGVSLIHAIEPAAVILERMVTEAEALLKGAGQYVKPLASCCHHGARSGASGWLDTGGKPRYDSLLEREKSGNAMHFALTEEQAAIQEMALTFAKERIAPHAAEWDETCHFPVDVIKETAALGMATIYVPAEQGGSGLSRLDGALIMEALAYGCPSIAGYISIHNMVAVDGEQVRQRGAGGGVDAEARLHGVAVELLPDRARVRARMRRASGRRPKNRATTTC
jgi:hypothetical protein